MRRTRNLTRQVESGECDKAYLPEKQKMLLEAFVSGKLHGDVDKANKAYGHGMARTDAYGFEPGDNMCTEVPMDEGTLAATPERRRSCRK